MRTTKSLLLKDKLQESSELLRALTHPLRMQILEYIDSQDHINVNKIYNTLNLEQSITSQHLRILRNAGIVETKRDGKYIFYSINYDKVKSAMEAINTFLDD
ncbi:MAG TPA: metalloregulator ArsR/SmtB family transcription factor [Saprospiraceae bacterium]|nr:metalloregulator ArsR/SmtB family transcription factor [Saprospiraceae bacterium]